MAKMLWGETLLSGFWNLVTTEDRRYVALGSGAASWVRPVRAGMPVVRPV